MKNRLEEIDVFRALSCLAVIVIHTSAGPVSSLRPGSFPLMVIILINSAARFAVPGFVFLSGFSLTFSDGNTGTGKSTLGRRFASILVPYLLWSLIYYLVYIRLGYYSFSWTILLEKLILADMIYHLYFVLLICQFYLLFRPIRFVFERFKREVVLLMMLLINLISIKLVYFKYQDRFFLQYLFFFGLGCYLALEMDRVKKILGRFKNYLILLYLAIILYYTYRFYQFYVLKLPAKNINLLWFTSCVFAILFFYGLSLFVSQKLRPIVLLKEISASSYYIYLSHPLILLFSQLSLDRWGYTSITGSFLINTFLIFFTVIPFSILYTKAKGTLFYKQFYNR